MLLDFKEIPEAHKGGGLQDTFELFCREFLDLLGLKIIQEPGRGADAGRDIISSEMRSGVVGGTDFKWLVSCKHKAHSGSSVGEADEINISDRIATAGCHGFLALYSTLPSASLITRLNGLGVEHSIFDREKIERNLLNKLGGVELAKRFFPLSIEKYVLSNPKPAQLFAEQGVLQCQVCKKNLFSEPGKSLICIWEASDRHIHDVYACCKGSCDRILQQSHRKDGHFDGWIDLSDVMIPTLYLRKLMTFMRNIQHGRKVEESAFDNFIDIMVHVFPFVARHLSAEEKEKVTTAIMLDDIGF
jgi:hypothetical protein